MAHIRVRVIVKGRVQGVFFRAHTQDEASRLGLFGWVCNLPDNSVEALIEGEEGLVNDMIRWFYTGSPSSSVTQVIVTEEDVDEEYDTFEILY